MRNSGRIIGESALLCAAGCGETVVDREVMYTKTGKVFHRGCLKCSMCDGKIMASGSFEENPNVVCVECITMSKNKERGGICFACGKTVLHGIVMGSKLYHVDCFTCTLCKKLIRDSKYVEIGSNQYCHDCGWGTCFDCGKIIKYSEAGLVALGRNFHSNCFKCFFCDIPLESNQQFFSRNQRQCCLKCSTLVKHWQREQSSLANLNNDNDNGKDDQDGSEDLQQLTQSSSSSNNNNGNNSNNNNDKKDGVSVRSLFKSAQKPLLQRTPEYVLADVNNLLNDPLGEKYFIEYLNQCFCMENFMFYLDVRQFNSLFNNKEAAAILSSNNSNNSSNIQIITRNSKFSNDFVIYANKIWEKYLAESSELSVNISSQVYSGIKTCITSKNINPQMYNLAYLEIYELLKNDIFPKFLKSQSCQSLVKELKQEKILITKEAFQVGGPRPHSGAHPWIQAMVESEENQ